MAVFCPTWWRIDRWIFWALVRIGILRRTHGTAKFSYLQTGVGRMGGPVTWLEEIELPMYEVR